MSRLGKTEKCSHLWWFLSKGEISDLSLETSYVLGNIWSPKRGQLENKAVIGVETGNMNWGVRVNKMLDKHFGKMQIVFHRAFSDTEFPTHLQIQFSFLIERLMSSDFIIFLVNRSSSKCWWSRWYCHGKILENRSEEPDNWRWSLEGIWGSSRIVKVTCSVHSVLSPRPGEWGLFSGQAYTL